MKGLTLSLERIKEHLDSCHEAMSNVGANGLGYLEMHLRLAVDWAYNLNAALQIESVSASDKELLHALAKSVIELNTTIVLALPDAIASVRNTTNRIISNSAALTR